MNILATRRKKRKAPKGKRTELGTFIQKHFGPVFGTKVNGTCPRMSNEKYIRNMNRHRKTFPKWAVSLHQINLWEAGNSDLKVCATLDSDNGLTLAYIDIDTHDGRGKTEDAVKLCQHIRQHYFPGMPQERVNERGVSCWVPVLTRTEHRPGYFQRATPDEYNRAIDRVQAHFRTVAAHLGLNLSSVEFKGKVYSPKFIDKACVAVKAGELMKPPPGTEFFTQPAIHWTRLLSPEFDPITTPRPAQVDLHEAQDDLPTAEELAAMSSFKPRLISEPMLDNLPDLDAWVERNFHDRPTRHNRNNIPTRRFSETLLAMHVLKPNNDGSNPKERYRVFIRELYQAGVFRFGFDSAIFSKVFHYLSDRNVITWKDNTYASDRACKWDLCQELRVKLGAILGKHEGVCSITFRRTPNALQLQDLETAFCDGEDLKPEYHQREDDMAAIYLKLDKIAHTWAPGDLNEVAA